MQTQDVQEISKVNREANRKVVPLRTDVSVDKASATGDPKTVSDQVIPVVQKLKAKPTFLGSVALSEIVASKTNPRREFHEMDELVASVSREGVIQPVLVRPLPASRKSETPAMVKYELVCGERRHRASGKAGLLSIPAMSIVLTDDEVLELQIVENGQRADVHPMDEAEAFEALEKLLRDRHQDALSEIAGRVGKTRAHVIRRMALLSLPKMARAAFRKGLFTQETAILIARIPNDKLRDSAADHIVKDEDLRDTKSARDFIEDNFMLSLGNAPFNRSDAMLLPAAGACAACPKRTGNQRTLFADVAESDVCADPVCFAAKRDAHYDRCAAAAKAQGLEVLSAEASKKLFPHNDRLNYGSGYVMMDSTNYDDPKHRTWKQLLGKNAPNGTLARASSGAAVVLWDEREIKRLLKENPPKDMRAALAASAERKEELRSQRRKDAIQKESRLRAHAETLTRVGKECKEQTLLYALIYALSDVRSGSEYVGKVTGKALARLKYKSVNVLIEKGSLADLRSFVLECAIGDLAASWKAQEALPTIAGLLGVDLKATTKTVQVEWDVKRQGRKKSS